MHTLWLSLCLSAGLILSGQSALAQLKHWPERKQMCIQCHGAKGVSPTPETPSLGGISEYFALLQLVDFREKNRTSPIMNEIVKGMSDDDLRAAAEFVGKQPRPPVPKLKTDPARMARAAVLADKHRCGQCHGPKYLGGEQMPPLLHQRQDYLLKAMKEFKAEKRLGDRAAMVEIMAPLSNKDMADLAYYFAHVKK